MKYFDAKQAARYLGVKPSTIYAYVSRGLLESRPMPDDVRRPCYRRADLDRLKRRIWTWVGRWFRTDST